MITTWDSLKALYYIRKNNSSPEYYYKGKFNYIAQFFHEKNLKFSEENVEQFLYHLCQDFELRNNKEISPSYYNKYLTMLKHIARKEGVDLGEFEGKKAEYEKTDHLTVKEAGRLVKVQLEYARDGEYKNMRWSLIIKVMLITAARPANIRALKWENLQSDHIGHFLHFQKTKNGEKRNARIPEDIRDEILQLRRYPHDYVFGSPNGQLDKCSLNTEIKKRCQKAGIKNKKITAQSLRGSGITAYMKKYPLEQVAKLISGHKNYNVLFNHYYDPESELAQEIVDHNLIQPKPPTEQDLWQDIRKVLDSYRGTELQPKIVLIEQYAQNLLVSN